MEPGAAIDAAGRVVAQLPAEQAAFLEVEVVPSDVETWAVRVGGAVGILGLVLASLMTLIEWLTGTPKRGYFGTPQKLP